MGQNGDFNISNPQSQEAGKYVIDAAGVLQEPGTPLPDTYGDNRLVIMARDPLWFFSYWEVTADRFNALRDQVGHEVWQTGRAVMRVYDVTGVGSDVGRTNRFFDIDIVIDVRSGPGARPQLHRRNRFPLS